jgi:hypothetical protein
MYISVHQPFSIYARINREFRINLEFHAFAIGPQLRLAKVFY